MEGNQENSRMLEVLCINEERIGFLFVPMDFTVASLKKLIYKRFFIPVSRQAIRRTPRGRDEKDSTVLRDLTFWSDNKIYCKDLGPQIGYRTGYILQYVGALLFYWAVFFLPLCFYSAETIAQGEGQNVSEFFPFNAYPVQDINNFCGGGGISVQILSIIPGLMWTGHFIKRIYESAFVHRFSRSTMPLTNLWKNCAYYCSFGLCASLYINHPLVPRPHPFYQNFGGYMFLLCQMGNWSIHALLRDLRPKGTAIRRIPYPSNNPFTRMFNLVSCPNYTYEIGAWIGFTMLTGCLPVFFFAVIAFYNMGVSAARKDKQYRANRNYPRHRQLILPYIL